VLGQHGCVILDGDGGEGKHHQPQEHSGDDERRPTFPEQLLLFLGQERRAAAVQLLELLPALCCLCLLGFCTVQRGSSQVPSMPRLVNVCARTCSLHQPPAAQMLFTAARMQATG
jgi:hypothetical protein